MAEIKKIFAGGVMNMDDDERLLTNDYPYAENVLISSDDSGNSGVVKNIYRNKKVTNLYLGENVKTVTPNFCIDEKGQKIYWMTYSTYGCFLLEYNASNNITTIILADTREEEQRVFRLDPDYLITGIEKIISESEEGDLLLWTDNNMEPCCINIDRAKSWGENNFTKEDIYLIKKPPRFAPICNPIKLPEPSNYLEERFVSIAYRYKYLDKEYSALSSYSNYQFKPKPFKFEYITGENLGMVNRANGILVSFNTGEKQVIGIDILAKQTNSNSLYKIATFEKELEGWGHNEERSFSFSNNKIYSQLPEKELLRQYDNVPLKAKALTLIENRPVFGNYVEGRNIVDADGNKIKVDYSVDYESTEFSQDDLEIGESSFPLYQNIKISKSADILLSKDKNLYIGIEIDTLGIYFSGYIEYMLPRDYVGFFDLTTDEDFVILIENVLSQKLAENHTVTGHPDWEYVSTDPFQIVGASRDELIIKKPVMRFTDTSGGTPYNFGVQLNTTDDSEVYITGGSSNSLKTNRDYEVGIIYLDEFNRATTVLVSQTSTVYIPQEKSIFQNKLVVTLNHRAPYWADRYKFVVKQQTLSYNTIYINEFYVDGVFRWIRLDGENKDKVKENDILILKSDRVGYVRDIIKTKIIEIKEQDEDFIKDNVDINGIEIVEPAGLYAKIKPEGYAMDYNPDEFDQNGAYAERQIDRPIGYVDLFSTEDPDNPGQYLDRELYQGDQIKFYFRNEEKKDGDARLTKSFTIQEDYDNFEEWFDEIVAPTNLTAENGDVFENVSVVRGIITPYPFRYVFTPSLTGKRYLMVEGIYAGNNRKRTSRLWLTVTIRSGRGIFIYETEPKEIDTEIYYETEQTFEITEGNHSANTQNQNGFTPAIATLDFFNCYAQGNGAESYQVKDSILKNFLNVDLRPSAVQLEEYKEIRRFADLTYGESFVESSGRNGLNEFNQSTENYKELDKQFGSVQRLFSRETDLLVHQEGKTSKVLFGKDLLTTAEGIPVVSKIPQILGQQIPFAGDNGIGNNPESAVRDSYRVYYANPRRGTPMRLSMDGTEEINRKMVAPFRKSFADNPNGIRIGGYDPYNRHYLLSEKATAKGPNIVKPNQTISISETDAVFTYQIPVTLTGTLTINYAIDAGNATITAIIGENEFTTGDINGSGTLDVTVESAGTVTVTITPESEKISFTVSNTAPTGKAMAMYTVILNDAYDVGKNAVGKLRWNNFGFYTFNDLLTEDPIFRLENGTEGVGKFPARGSTVDLQAVVSDYVSAEISESNYNRIGYVVSSTEYEVGEIDVLVAAATWLDLETTGNVVGGSFEFEREDDENLYLLFDYTDRIPLAVDDRYDVEQGAFVECNVLENDFMKTGTLDTLTIVSKPMHGTATIEVDNTITYEHDDGMDAEDSFTYKFTTEYGESNVATVLIKITPTSLGSESTGSSI